MTKKFKNKDKSKMNKQASFFLIIGTIKNYE
jgi:hypothetical protein